MIVGCVLVLAVLGGCSKQVSYEPAPLDEVPAGESSSSASPAVPSEKPQAGASAKAAPSPKSGQLLIDCAMLALKLPADWPGSEGRDSVWTYDLKGGSVTVHGEYEKVDGPIKGSDLVELALGSFGKDGVTQVRGDGTVAGKGRTAGTVEWRLAKSASGSTEVAVIVYDHAGEPAVENTVSLLDKAVGRATLSDIGDC